MGSSTSLGESLALSVNLRQLIPTGHGLIFQGAESSLMCEINITYSLRKSPGLGEYRGYSTEKK